MTKEIKKVMNLDNPIPDDSLNGYLFSNENKGHKFIISCTKGGELQTLTGSVTVRFMRANNTTILLGQGGSDGRENYAQIVDGNAEVTLHPDCYNVPGRFKISIFNISGDTVSCIYVGVGTVSRTQNGELIDSGDIVPSIDELVGYIDDCIAATENAEEAADHAVRYDVAQTLTDTQKAQARTNIDASSQSDVDDLKSAFDANQDALIDGILEQPLIWETGSISTSTGQEADNSNYKRTRGYIRYYTGATLYNGSDTMINVLAYNDDYTFNASKSYTLSPNSSWTTEDADQIYYMRIRVLASATNIDSITFVKNTGIYTSIEKLETAQGKIEKGLLSGDIEIEPVWSVGSISSSTGADATNNNFKRTDYILATTETKVKNDSDTPFYLFGYSGNTSETFISPAAVVAANAEYEIPSAYKYIRLRVTSDFDTTDITVVGNHIYNKQEIQEIAGSQGGKVKTTQKLAVIGDSLSDTDYHTAHKWMYFLSEYDGYSVTNLAVAGSSYFNGSNKGGTSDHQFYNQATLVPNDTDIVLAFGSFNDIGFLYRGEVTIGTVDDTGTTTIGGCFNRMLSNLYAINPGMKIGIVIPTPWTGYNPGMAESNQYYQSVMDYVAFLERICKYNSIPFMNLFYESGMRPWNADFRNLYYWEADGTHPNEAGQLNYIYPKMREFLRKLNCQNI